VNINQKVRSELTLLKMNIETSEHVNLAIKVFKWIIFPASILYICADFYFFRENAIDSMLWGLLIFFYSNFLPDLPSIYRKKEIGNNEELQWYKKYAILLFAPLLIWVLFSGVRLGWRTTETFHNFKSLAIYGMFLLLLGFFAFGNFPILIGGMAKILSFPIYGIIGYLTHLKVDKIW
jgi:hypothetical protein